MAGVGRGGGFDPDSAVRDGDAVFPGWRTATRGQPPLSRVHHGVNEEAVPPPSGPTQLHSSIRPTSFSPDEAAADFSRAIELRATDGAAWYGLACVCLERGDRDGYRRTRVQALERLGATATPLQANTAAWLCLLTRDALADFERPVALAQRAVGREPRNALYGNTLGVALYRAGRFAEAARQLHAAVDAHGKGGTAPDWLFLTLAEHHLGHPDEARRALARAREVVDAEAGSAGRPWPDRLELRLFRQEAEQGVNGPLQPGAR